VVPALLVGVVGGYETFDYTSQDLNGRLKGNGWTVGSYLGWKLAPAIRFDAALAYSGIDYDGSAGTAQGNFDGHRWLLSGGLTGDTRAYGFDIEPSARVYALWEHENAYTDTLGTRQADRDFAEGRASGGVKFSYPFAWRDSVTLAPYAGLYGDYYFSHDNAATIVAAGAALPVTPYLDGRPFGENRRRRGGRTRWRIWWHRQRHPHLDLSCSRGSAVLSEMAAAKLSTAAADRGGALRD
jgi:outer membrane autotransporter protein